MPRKQVATEEESIPDGDKRQVNAKLSPALHKVMRRIAAEDEVSMSVYVSRIVARAVREDAARRGFEVPGHGA